MLMRQAVLRVDGLPPGALDAAAAFHATWLPLAREALATANALTLLFSAAPYDHRGWRLAVVQDLARDGAPKRVNGVAGDDQQAIAAAADWLGRASGVTGQLLGVD